MVSLSGSDKAWRDHCASNFGSVPKTDLALLAKQGGTVFGVVPTIRMSRLVRDLPAQRAVRSAPDAVDTEDGAVWFEFTGVSQTGRRPRVTLKAQAIVVLVCQRCLGEMRFAIDETVEFELFGNEAQANAALGAEESDPEAPEPLVVDGPVDLMAIVEDQLILAIPYVPKHPFCEQARKTAGEPIEPAERESPFRVLENLKRDLK